MGRDWRIWNWVLVRSNPKGVSHRLVNLEVAIPRSIKINIGKIICIGKIYFQLIFKFVIVLQTF
jgi:hypothetical protein